MAKTIKQCDTCAYEPDWGPYTYPNGHSCIRGRCKFPKRGMKMLKAHGLPQGASLSVPYVRRDDQKKQCPAWRAKES